MEQAFSDVTLAIKEEPAKIRNTIELHSLYSTSLLELNVDDYEGMEELGCQEYTNRYQCANLRLESNFQNSLLVMKIDGCASLACLREHAPQNLKIVAATDADPVAEVV